MVNLRLTSCPQCSDIMSLINDIDCKITEVAKNLYNNIVFDLNMPIPMEVMIDLINYKRILRHKFCNPDYAKSFSVNMIANKVKILKFK